MHAQLGRIARITVAAGAALAALSAADSRAAEVSKVAVSGEPAPGGGSFVASFLGVSINDAEDVTFSSEVTGALHTGGVFARRGGVLESVALTGEAAPGGGTHFLFGGFPQVHEAGAVSYFSVALDETSIWGVFLDSGPGPDAMLLMGGDPAPSPPGGSFDPSGSWDLHSYDSASAVHAFVSKVVVPGDERRVGFFQRSGATASALALEGDAAPGGGSLVDFRYADRSDSGHAAYVATLAAGPAASGLFHRTPSGSTRLVAHVGDPAPDSDGASYYDLIFPRVNDAGQLVFLAGFDESGNEGGVFLHRAGETQRVLGSGDPYPGAGGGSVAAIPSMIPIDPAGDLALPITSTGSAAGVFRYRRHLDAFEPLVQAGEIAPDTGGATYTGFGFLDTSDAGSVVFLATLSNGETGVFVASGEAAPLVPASGTAGLVGLAVALLVIGGLLLRGRPSLA